MFLEDNYPHLLREIADPPIVLFYRGNMGLLTRPCLSVVGSRKVTKYGREVLNEFIPQLVGRGIVIISGMAFGVDGLAHLVSLKHATESTIAVLASPVDQPTPQSNRYIYQKILDLGGLVLSEAIPGKELHKGMFASRNRIIAGLSLGTLVVEAGEKSGALITSQLALENGREVFAVPGDIDRVMSRGTNSLIQSNSAKLVLDYRDIINEISFDAQSTVKLTSMKKSPVDSTEIVLLEKISAGYDTYEELLNQLPNYESNVILSMLGNLELGGHLSLVHGNYVINKR